MRNHGRFILRRAALCALLLACGCNLPGTFGVSSEPTPSPTKTGTPHPLVAPAAGANSTGPVTGPGPAPVLPLNLAGPESPQDVISLQAQKLNDAAQDHNLLAARILQLEGMLQDKDRELSDVKDEIRNTLEEVTRTRAENNRLKKDNADLRERLKKADEHVRLLNQLNADLEKRLKNQAPPPMPPEPGMDKEP